MLQMESEFFCAGKKSRGSHIDAESPPHFALLGLEGHVNGAAEKADQWRDQLYSA